MQLLPGSLTGFDNRVEQVDLQLPFGSDPSPATHERTAAEQGLFDRQQIEARHILRGVYTKKQCRMGRLGHTQESYASAARVQ
ncbi:hypothetical protein GGQ65_000815 [Rhizobium fabae]|uniref:Uncharacterized protein n=1 Tax=Rhizobium fabae TaxID=573179 RepID=A0A7W6B8X9_9HYPH|nr:hypothetical protein [Rhizobium fabae]